jgi:hypothetical protein
MQGFSLRAFDIDYRQPRLSIDDAHSVERPMLLSARNRQGAVSLDVEREEAKEVLSFIYTRVYPEGYSSDPAENQAYREYCIALRDKEVAALPERVRVLSSKQLVAQVRNNKRATQAGEC